MNIIPSETREESNNEYVDEGIELIKILAEANIIDAPLHLKNHELAQVKGRLDTVRILDKSRLYLVSKTSSPTSFKRAKTGF